MIYATYLTYDLKKGLKERRVPVRLLAEKCKMQRSYLYDIIAERCRVKEKTAKKIISELKKFNK